MLRIGTGQKKGRKRCLLLENSSCKRAPFLKWNEKNEIGLCEHPHAAVGSSVAWYKQNCNSYVQCETDRNGIKFFVSFRVHDLLQRFEWFTAKVSLHTGDWLVKLLQKVDFINLTLINKLTLEFAQARSTQASKWLWHCITTCWTLHRTIVIETGPRG